MPGTGTRPFGALAGAYTQADPTRQGRDSAERQRRAAAGLLRFFDPQRRGAHEPAPEPLERLRR